MAKIGMPLWASGSMKEASTPVRENGKGPSSLKQVQGDSHFAFCGSLIGRADDGQFFGGAGYADERRIHDRRWNRGVRRQAADGEDVWQASEF